jgi:hypothetical protein
MAARMSIRRLELRCLTPRDHAASGDLARRLAAAAKALLPQALEKMPYSGTGDAILRIRRLEVDVTLDSGCDPHSFAQGLARAIAQELFRAAERGSCDGVVSYPSRAIYLAALLEALAEGRAAERWWLRDAEGLRFLAPAQAIRTAIAADVRMGQEALASLPRLRRMAVLRVLTPIESERVLHEFAGEGGDASLAACAQAIRDAVGEGFDAASALGVYIETFARKPSLAGAALAAAARLWVEIIEADGGEASGPPEEPSNFSGGRAPPPPASTNAGTPEQEARRVLAAAAAERGRPSTSAPLYRFTPFGGLLMLLPDLGYSDIADAASAGSGAPAGTAALVAWAALGLCAGQGRFGEYAGDGLWRELFALDPRAAASTIAARLGDLDDELSTVLAPLAAPLDNLRDARFLLAPRSLVASRPVARVLAGLARAATRRFARRLPGFRDASAAFLWANVLATSAALERRTGGWSARLSRAPLDVLVSLARVAEGNVEAPCGERIHISRTPP